MIIALLGMDTRGDQSNFRARTDAITLLNINFAAQTASMQSDQNSVSHTGSRLGGRADRAGNRHTTEGR